MYSDNNDTGHNTYQLLFVLQSLIISKEAWSHIHLRPCKVKLAGALVEYVAIILQGYIVNTLLYFEGSFTMNDDGQECCSRLENSSYLSTLKHFYMYCRQPPAYHTAFGNIIPDKLSLKITVEVTECNIFSMVLFDGKYQYLYTSFCEFLASSPFARYSCFTYSDGKYVTSYVMTFVYRKRHNRKSNKCQNIYLENEAQGQEG